MCADGSSPTSIDAAPRVSVVVPHWNDLPRLARCLETLEAQSLARAAYEIIVADNMTPGGLGDLAERFPAVTFVEARERGAACARNAGLAVARGDAIAFIDADCEAHPDWLREGLASLDDAELCGGAVDVTIARVGAPSPVESFEKAFAFHQRDYVERKGFSVTANLFARAEAARAVGPFTNGVAEDKEWCERAGALGFRLVFNANAIVRHPARTTWRELVAKWDRLIRERWNGRDRRGGLARVQWAALAVATALSAGPHLAVVAASPRLDGPRERLAAAATLTRIRVWRAGRMLALLWGAPPRSA